MRTRDFIGRVVNGYQTNPRTVSSVVFDGQHIYSYGSHYPLLVHIGTAWILNDRGYSNTTAKHINWAGEHADMRMEIHGERLNAEELHEAALKQQTEVMEKLASLRKGAFRKKEHLEWRKRELDKTINYLFSQLRTS